MEPLPTTFLVRPKLGGPARRCTHRDKIVENTPMGSTVKQYMDVGPELVCDDGMTLTRIGPAEFLSADGELFQMVAP